MCTERMLDNKNNLHITTLALEATTCMLLQMVTTDMLLRGTRNVSSTGDSAKIDLLGQNSGFCIFGEGEIANDISDDVFD